MADRFGETLLAPSMVRLFGRLFAGLKLDAGELAALFGEPKVDANGDIVRGKDGAPVTVRNPFVRNPLVDKLTPIASASENPDKIEPALARIYGFSFEGNYYKLSRPAIFLVHGPGQPVTAGQDPITLSSLGVEFKDQVFALEVRMWAYDKLDMSLRIDMASGQLLSLIHI